MSAVLVESGPDKGAIWHFGEPNQEQKALVQQMLGQIYLTAELSQSQAKIALPGYMH
jgi:hypothetical protein